MRIILHPEATDEVLSVHAYYEGEEPGLGDRFVLAVDAAMDKVRENPTRWPQFLKRTRRYRLDRFPYGIVYILREEEVIEVLAVMGLRRRPNYWTRRLKK